MPGSVALVEKVARSGADIGVSTVPPPAGWESRRVARIGVAAHVAPDHPLAGHRRVEVADLAAHRLILMDRTNLARLAFDEALASAGGAPARTTEMRSSFMAQGAAACGRGVAVLTDAPAFGLVTVPIEVDGERLRLWLYAGWDRTHYAREYIEDWVGDFADWLPIVPEVVGGPGAVP